MDHNTVEVARVAIIAGAGALIAITAIISRVVQRIVAARPPSASESTRESDVAIEALRRELHELRDTATRFDMSFDTALQRLEARMAGIENRSTVPAAEAVVEQSHVR
jgi:hypothetical protein